MQFVLLVRLGFAGKVPGYLGSRAALDGGRDPDRISSTNKQQVIHDYVNADGRWDC